MMSSARSVVTTSWVGRGAAFALGMALCGPAPADAGTYAAFGPERYVRTTGAPNDVTRTFSVLDPGAPYTLLIVNGGGSADPISSAVVTLNGVDVVQPNEFNQNVELIEKPVSLLAQNELRIDLRSAPESGFDLVILGQDDVPPSITASLSPAPNAAGWNNRDVTVSFACADERSGVAFCPAPVVVSAEGAGQVVVGTVFDMASNRASVEVAVSLDRTPPTLVFVAPAPGQITNTESAIARVSATDASGVAAVEVNGVAASPAGAFFEAVVPLQEGANTLTATARDLADNVQSASIPVVRFTLPEIAIASPAPQTLTREAAATVSGTVSPNVVSVSVNGITGTVSGTSFSVPGVPLFEGNNLLAAVAADGSDRMATASVQVIRDTTPPRLAVHSPLDGLVTAAEKLSVSGMVNDLVIGSLDASEARVTVNGLPASVSNRNFLATDVPLGLGPNTITVPATDLSGNTSSVSLGVQRVQAAGPRLSVVGGDLQQGPIGTELPQPLIVSVTDPLGNPISGQPVAFRVADNDGSLGTPQGSGPTTLLTTDAQGQAQVHWTLGNRAGPGRNRVEANAPGVIGTVVFTATGLSAPPALINVDAGNLQFGAVGRELPRPLVAVVTDAGHNRLPGVPVSFQVVAGGGGLAGQTSLTVEADAYGRALAALTLGPEPGRDGNVVEADFPGNPGSPAVFRASALPAGDPAATRVSGVVLDNSNIPIQGATLRIEETALSTRTDPQGQFTIPGAPVGRIRLVADGATAERPGTWPSLEYELVTVAGQDNALGMPIYLLPIDVARGVFVDEARGGTLRVPELPGFSLTIAPGSATFPGGGKSGVVSVTLVHADKVPMVPNFGQQPRFIITIQPAGVRFDPPAAMTLPNVDGLPPRAVTEMYSFDHDLGMFVSIGTATVSADGSLLRSDPGVGVIEGGWHCGGNPASAGGAASCSVTITTGEPVKTKKDQTATISASGGPQPGTYSWSTDRPDIVSFQGPTSGPTVSSVTIKALKGGKAKVTVTFTSQSGASDQDDIKVLVATPDVTVVAWVDPTGPEAARKALKDAAGFFDPLNILIFELEGEFAFATCPLLLGNWALGFETFLFSDTERKYANAFLLANSGNKPPPDTIIPEAVQAGGDYRLFNRLQVTIDPDVPSFDFPFLQSAALVGGTPYPCPSIVKFSASGEAHSDNGASVFNSSQTAVYQLNEGRLSDVGQKINKTINGRSTPFVWSVVRFNLQSELDPGAIDHAIFPTYSLYEDGQLVATFPQANHEAFIALDATYQRLPSEVP